MSEMQDRGSEPSPVRAGRLVRMHGRAWGLALGILCAMGLFVATNVLVLRGGEDVGATLGRLGWYFPGYDVTFVGSLVGALYAFLVGYFSGRLVCWVYNLTAGSIVRS